MTDTPEEETSVDLQSNGSNTIPCTTSTQRKSLESMIDSLTLKDRSSLYIELRNIYRNGHFYHHEWPTLKTSHPHLFDTSFDLLRKFESNGLQLHGYGCWFFQQVVVSVGLHMDDSDKVKTNQVLEVVLRVLLEHSCYTRCVQIFHTLCESQPERFGRLCEIGFDIFEALPVPIQSGNFCALFVFTFNFLRVHWPVVPTASHLQALRMLAVISTRVETSLLSEYHLEAALTLCHRIYEELKALPSYESFSALSILFQFLKNSISLHHNHAKIVKDSGFFDFAMDFIVQEVVHEEKVSSGGLDDIAEVKGCLCAAVQLIESAVGSSDVVNNSVSSLALFPQLKLVHIGKVAMLGEGLCLEEAVRLFFSTFAHFVSRHSQEITVQNHNCSIFLHICFDQAIEILKLPNTGNETNDELNEKNIGDNDVAGDDVRSGLHKQLWTSIRLLGRDAYFLRLLEHADFAQKRSDLLDLIEGVLEGCDSESFDMQSGVMCVDAMGTLSGWMDNSWRDTMATDRHIQGIQEAASVKFLKKCSSLDDEDETEILEHEQHKVRMNSTVSSNSDFRRSEAWRVEQGEDDERLSHIRSSLHTLDLVTTPIFEEECETIIEKERAHERDSTCNAKIETEDLEDFLLDWEVDSTAAVCFKVMKLVGISRNHPQGLASLQSLDLAALSEVLVELLLDDRHGLHDEDGMQEKCIQLLTDLMMSSDTVGAMVAEHVDTIIEIFSDWSNFEDIFLIQSCMSALIGMAKFGNAGRRILDNFDKIQVMSEHLHNPIFLLSILELCGAILPSFKKANYSQEVIMFNWLMQCLSYKTKPMIIRACQLIYHISEVNGQFISKACSRFEVEDYFLNILDVSEDKELLLASLRTLTVLANRFNNKPYWVRNRWLSLSTFIARKRSGHRVLCSLDFMSTLLNLQFKFEEPFNLIILAFSLDIISTIRCLPSGHLGGVDAAAQYSTQFYTVYMPLAAGLLAMITRLHTFCDIPEDVDDVVTKNDMTDVAAKFHRGASGDSSNSMHEGDESVSEPPSCFNALMSMALLEINPVYELLGASAVNALYSLIMCIRQDDDDEVNLEAYHTYSELFANTPICEAIIYIMIQLPNNYVVQVKGIIALEALLSRGIGARILSACCTRVLTSAIVSFVDDDVVHHAFCSIVNILSTRGERTSKDMVCAGVHKWLYVVIKAGSPVTAHIACHAVYNLVQNSTESTAIVGESGIVRPTLLLLETYPDNLKVQFEGLQLVTALCREKSVFRVVRDNNGEQIITTTRKMLTDVMRTMPGWKNRSNILSRASMTGSPISMRDSALSIFDIGRKSHRSSELENIVENDESKTEENDSDEQGEDKHDVENKKKISQHDKFLEKSHSSGIEDENMGPFEYTSDQMRDLLDKSSLSRLSHQKCVIM
eukprot:CAMPEP_0114478772 /NCGR_PEP_ID=MMETSP0104-20121206/16173_1 /TAXON_ID=37642 ORGANISM="Paraphysomonas imperforata, Strain PA2" /NCGR_SAMPLE_ID=MMETSP0104 /ASSEMBLY_ACC=CAM_ASM_000202 /LENGTH=1399 /DNA_ID=CAMNT_0001654005 /DNA_START=55 /DNA_END=4255 /DNA_ORIENTATION=-